MRNLKLFAMTLFVAVLGMSFASCSDDDDEVGSASDVVGTWILTTSSGWTKEDGKIVDEWENEARNDERTVFNPDGSFESYELSDGQWEISAAGTWLYKDGKLNTYDSDGELLISMTVKSVTATHAELEYYVKVYEDNHVYETYECMTYRKAN